MARLSTIEDGRPAPSGIYFYELLLGSEIHHGRVTLVK
jgi:hypothetical protein